MITQDWQWPITRISLSKETSVPEASYLNFKWDLKIYTMIIYVLAFSEAIYMSQFTQYL